MAESRVLIERFESNDAFSTAGGKISDQHHPNTARISDKGADLALREVCTFQSVAYYYKSTTHLSSQVRD